jgi:dienelactone hydrolase
MRDFQTAITHFQAITAHEHADPQINPACRSLLLHHTNTTPRAIVFLHGITSSPRQFADLGQLFFERGYNVLIPRMPKHGYTNRLTSEPKHLASEDFIGYATRAIEIATHLGEHLTLGGLSVSGSIAAWCTQQRPEVDLSVLMAPACAPFGVPIGLVRPLARLTGALPNMFVWWDPRQRARLGPACSYPRFSTHAMAAAFRIAADVYAQARHAPPSVRHILNITNSRDMAVNNGATRKLLRRWQDHGALVREHIFRGEVGHLHDFIGPYQPGARPDLVYPLLFELVDQRA